MADQVTFEGAPFYDFDGDFVAMGSDGQLYHVDEDVYAQGLVQAIAREEWIAEGSQNAELLEHRLERPLTAKERQTIADDMRRGDHTDAFNAYEANFPEDRTRDPEERLDLMAEYMDEAAAEQPDDTPTDQEVD
jgi:hypothetical protein